MTVYVVGSINGDVTLPVEELPAPGATVLAGEPVRSGGGKGANVAVAAARDGQRVRMVGAVGDDEPGERSLAELRRERVDTGGVARLEETETGFAMICVDGEGENLIVVVPGANSGLLPSWWTTLSRILRATTCAWSASRFPRRPWPPPPGRRLTGTPLWSSTRHPRARSDGRCLGRTRWSWSTRASWSG